MNESEYQRVNLLAWIIKKETRIDRFADSVSVDGNAGDDDFHQFKGLSNSEKAELIAWIVNAFEPTEGVTDERTSQDFRYYFGHTPLGFHVTNGAFKGAMLTAGFFPQSGSGKDWRFDVTPASVERIKQVTEGKAGWDEL